MSSETITSPEAHEGSTREAYAARRKMVQAQLARKRIAIWTAIAALGSMIPVGVWQTIRDSETEEAVLRAETASRATRQVLAAVLDAETGQRGFLLTSSPQFLDPYHHAVKRLPAELALFNKAVAGVPTNSDEPLRMTNLVAAKVAELEATVDLKAKQGDSAALAVVRNGEGNRIMTQLRELAASLDGRYLAYSLAEQTAADRSRRVSLAITTIGSILAAAVLLLAARRLRRSYAEQDELLLRISEREHQYQRLSDRLQLVREEERAHLAREIHDVLGQCLTAIKLDLAGVLRRLDAGDPQGAAEKVRQGLSGADEAIRLMRRIASELRPPLLDHIGLSAAIKVYTEEFAARTGIAFTSNLHTEGLNLSPDERIAFYRIYQESLTNIARHSGAKTARVALTSRSDAIFLQVEDNGRGFNLQKAKTSLGLLGMQERARLIGAKFSVTSEVNRGTLVEVTLPQHVAD